MHAYTIDFSRMSQSEIAQYEAGRRAFFGNLWSQAKAANGSRQLQRVLRLMNHYSDKFPPAPLELYGYGYFTPATPHR